MEVTSLPQIISLKEARKILGKNAHAMSDNQVKELIAVLTSMAEQFLQNTGS